MRFYSKSLQDLYMYSYVISLFIRYIAKLHNESISLTKEKLEEEMSHPVKVYRFFSELMTDLAGIDKLIGEGTAESELFL